VLSVFPNNRERFAPITLTRKQPVAQFVIDRAFTETVLFKPRCDFPDRLSRWQAINNRRIDCDPFADESNRIFAAQRLHHFANGQMEFSRKLEVAFVVSGHAHNRAGSITKQDIIANPDRNPLVVYRIDCVSAGENARLFLRQFRSFQVALARCPLAIVAHSWPVFFGYD